MAPLQRKREALVGVGIAGAVLGCLVAALGLGGAPAAEGALPAARATTPSARADRPIAAAREPARPDPLAPVVEALAAAHARVHAEEGEEAGAPAGGEGAAPAAKLPEALERAIREDPWLRSLRLDFHRAAGAGAFADPQGLTPLGEALLARLGDLERHDLDPARYDMPALAEAAEAFRGRLAGQGVAPPAAAGPAGPVMAELVRAPRFDPARALERLRAAGGAPRPEHAAALADALLAARKGPEVADEAYALEARLGKALVRLVLDFRFLRTSGPFELVRDEARFVDKKRSRKAVLAALAEVVEAPDAAAGVATLDPRHPFYEPMLAILAHYRDVVARDCHVTLPTSWRLRPGMSGPEVAKLQRRLACEGYYAGEEDGVYGDALLEAVKDYQRHHEMDEDGLVFESSLRSLNVPMTRRLEQVQLAVLRLRESRARTLDDYFIRVNVPAFELQVFDKGELLRRQNVIVGTNRLDDDKVRLIQGHINRTELFTTKLYQVIANPDWILPERVEKGEVKAKLAEDPDYLEKNGIVKATLGNGRTVLVQRGGAGNVLGKVKFLLEKSQAIYLHDTDKRELFRERRRDFSHGCIRVHEALDFAEWLLVRDGWDADEVRRSLGAKSVQRGMDLKAPVDLVTEYVTVDVAPDGKAVFLTDIYGFDRDYAEGNLPPKVEARWGGPVLRPGWVPSVPPEVVDGWRKAGKPAPHAYDPKAHAGGLEN